MILVDKKFKKKLKNLGINLGLYKRYVDDIVVGLRGISPGWFYDKASNKMQFDAQNQYSTWESDARTLAVLRDIANSIDSDIQFETDVPSAHQSGRLPVLDLHLFVANNQIQLGFFQQPVSSPFLILQRSALGPNT